MAPLKTHLPIIVKVGQHSLFVVCQKAPFTPTVWTSDAWVALYCLEGKEKKWYERKMKVCQLKFIRHVRILDRSHPSGRTQLFNPGIHVSGGWINRDEAARSWMGLETNTRPSWPTPWRAVCTCASGSAWGRVWRRLGSRQTRLKRCEEVKRLFQPQSEEPLPPVVHLCW